jgi:hypothetical protein
MTFLKKAFRISLVLALLLAAGLAAGMSWLWVRHNRQVTLPVPPGPYPVGRIAYDWTDSARLDPLANEPGQKRKLTVFIWYPAASLADQQTAPYLPAAWVGARQPRLIAGSFLLQNLARVQVYALADAQVSETGAPFPVLIMQPGLGPLITDYSTLAEGLASQGYVVVGSNPTYSASMVVFQDGTRVAGTPAGNVPDNASEAEARRMLDSLIEVWAADDRFILDQVEDLNASDPTGRFRGKLDLNAVGIFGHSFGGAAAAQVCMLDVRCKAGIDLDGYPYGSVVQIGLHQPFLFIWCEPPDPNDSGWLQALRDSQAITSKSPSEPAQVTIAGMRHFNFTDQAIFFSPVLKRMGLLGSIDGQRGLEIVLNDVHTFFDHHLKPDRSGSSINNRFCTFPLATRC